MERWARDLATKAAVVVVGMLVLEVAYGVAPDDALLYLGWLIAFVITPGTLVLLALDGRSRPTMRTLCVGWALGYVLLVLSFMLTAAIDARWSLSLYPVAAIAIAGPIALRSRLPGTIDPDRPWTTALACLALLGMGSFAIAYFPTTPLPGGPGVSYFPDYVWHVSLIAEALHHWPIEDPHAVGDPLPYHYFVHLQAAAAAQSTGLEPSLLLFRLTPLPMVLLLALSIADAGRSMLGNRWTGLLAALLALLVADMQINPEPTPFGQIPFLGTGFALLFGSPSYLLGMVIFVPLLALVGERLVDGGRGTIGDWIVITLLAVGASVAKVTILPVLLAASATYGAWKLWDCRRIPRAVMIASACLAAPLAVSWLLLWRGHSGGLELDPLRTFAHMPAVFVAKAYLLDQLGGGVLARLLLGALGVFFGFIGLMAPQLIGLAWLRRLGVRMDEIRVWLLIVLGWGTIVLMLLGVGITNNQLYFVFLGTYAGAVLAAEGLRLAWRARPGFSRRQLGVAAALAGAWLVTFIVLALVPQHVFDGGDATALTLVVRYGALAVSLVLLYLAARRWGASTWLPPALVTGAVVWLGAMSVPFSFLLPSARGEREAILGIPLAVAEARAFVWIREEIPYDSVIAINTEDKLQFNASAFSEHRLFLEGWQYSQSSIDLGFDEVAAGTANPNADRLALNTAAFAGDECAVQEMESRYGVQYLVIDALLPTPADVDRIRTWGEVVYDSGGVMVIRLSSDGKRGEPSC